MSDYNNEHHDHDQQHESNSQDHNSQTAVLSLSANDFTALEERILRTVEVVRRERQGRATAEERATRLEGQLRDQAPLTEQLENEINALRAERDQVRERVERLLGQLDALEL
jgi:hypothetical protein